MNKTITIFLWLCLPLFCIAQNQLTREYEYDAAGNRILRKTVRMQAPPEPPKDSLEVVASTGSATELLQDELASVESQLPTEYYVENLARVEMKIYPNPATEKVTFAISNLDNLQTGTLQLYSLNGQLLQTQPVLSNITEISLEGLAKGTYILKVQINEKTENWKIIKN
jgi:hypothetical protein